MKYVSNDRGLMPILVAVIAIAVVAAAAVAVYEFNVHHTSTPTAKTPSSPASSPSASASPSTNPTADWTTSTSSLAKFSIKYPSAWTYRAGSNNGGAETNYLTSPNDFQIEFISFTPQSEYGQQSLKGNPSGGNCDPTLATNSSESFNAPGYGFLVLKAVTCGVNGGDGMVNELMLETENHSGYIVSPKAANVYTSIDGLFQGQQNEDAYSQFAASADVQTAEQILKTLSY